jgi:hypothetical protein
VTAPAACPELPLDSLRDALRHCAVGCLPELAAVELLIAHGYWLASDDFRVCIEIDGTGDTCADLAEINWGDALLVADQLEARSAAAALDLALLRIAAAIADGELGRQLRPLDATSGQLVAQAVLRAIGGGS